MAGNRSRPSLQPSDVLKRIEDFIFSVVSNLSDRNPEMVQIDRFRIYCSESLGKCYCSSDIPTGKEVLTVVKESHMRRLEILFRVLSIVQKLLKENRHGSKRDIYYMHPDVFKDQSLVDRAINDICILLQCRRHNLNVVSAGNGLVMGWLRFSEAGRIFDCINSPNNPFSVPVYVEDVKDIISVAQYILVVEKESVFQRLANDGFCAKNRCIVITGRGYPDVPTRRFLCLLIEKLHLPTYCLVDCDPHGFDILTTYRFGSMQMAYDAKSLRIPDIRWLGVFPSEIDKYNLPKQCLLPFSKEDKTKAEAISLRCYLTKEAPKWKSELELMIQRGTKCEIEALSVHSLSFLARDYLPAKIAEGFYH